MNKPIAPLAKAYLVSMGLYDEVIEKAGTRRAEYLLGRAYGAADLVEQKFEAARLKKELSEFNKRFKAARIERPKLQYADFAMEFKRDLMAQFCKEMKARLARF